MAKAKNLERTTVEVEALIRFPWQGRPYFAGQRLSVTPDEARNLIDEKICGPVGSYRRRDMQAEGE
jgi:hypothetical protein